ncbi:mini-chromosome maintenance complex-binding protein [Sitophilus oryzae]|uniref:Mini-chromosome maintenance complex-binding protein n=1 Tax=Sitophilus oryzae TaxID=7048 RepID=A0A6J2YNJ9_SITOR|nr:mini-chromosome maintenance complex-binding protein [Sitophilus oryzae]
MDITNISIEDWIKDEEAHLKSLEERDVWEKVPLINSNPIHEFNDGTLLRFRGMIQDMHGPEYYMVVFNIINEQTNEKTVKNSKYRDIIPDCAKGEQIDMENNTHLPEERHSYAVVSVPGVNSWVTHYESVKYKLETKSDHIESTSNQNKRTYNEAMETDAPTESNLVKKPVNTETATPKPENSLSLSPEYILNHPLGDSKGTVCHMKVYKESENLKLNDVCEFVGFLSLGSVQCDEDDLEMQTHHPPTSLVPRIHVVHFKKMTHYNPLVDSELSGDVTNFVNIRKELLIVLTQLLLGDVLAAEYMICHLVSEIYLRKDYMALGQFSLNISNVPKLENFDYVKEVYKFLELLVPKSHYLPLTLENMNTLEFIPKKDYESNRLNSGILQLSQNTLLVLDETKLEEGKLDVAGVKSVKCLAQAIKNQKVSYDFNYYPLEYDCDIQFLIFSEGKSMLPSDVLLPLKPDDTCLNTFGEILEAANHFLKPELLNQIRIYLTRARLIQYEISDQVQNLVQQEFVNMRQNGNVTAQDLHGLLVLCRLICISEGKQTLDPECWKRACEMEKERKARIPK